MRRREVRPPTPPPNTGQRPSETEAPERPKPVPEFSSILTGTLPASHPMFCRAFASRLARVVRAMFPALLSGQTLLCLLALALFSAGFAVLYQLVIPAVNRCLDCIINQKPHFVSHLTRCGGSMLLMVTVMHSGAFLGSRAVVKCRNALFEALLESAFSKSALCRAMMTKGILTYPFEHILTREVITVTDHFGKYVLGSLDSDANCPLHIFVVAALAFPNARELATPLLSFVVTSAIMGFVLMWYLTKWAARAAGHAASMEALFAAFHTDVAAHAELMDLNKAEKHEQSIAEQIFEYVFRAHNRTLLRTCTHFFLHAALSSNDPTNIASSVSYVALCVLQFRRSQEYSATAISNISLIVFHSLLAIFNIVLFVVRFSGVVASVHRIGEVFEELGRSANAAAGEHRPDTAGSALKSAPEDEDLPPPGRPLPLAPPADDKWVLEVGDVVLSAPTRRILAPTRLSFRVVEGSRGVLIVGGSGCGKSTLFRILLGIWAPLKGNMALRGPARGDSRIPLFAVPQRAYTFTGTLLDNVTYPYPGCPADEGPVRALLAAAHIGHLSPLLRCRRNWTTALSAGERQCLQFARLLYHRPIFGLIDDGWHLLSDCVQCSLARACRDANVTLIALSCRAVTAGLFDQVVALQSDEGLPEGYGLCEPVPADIWVEHTGWAPPEEDGQAPPCDAVPGEEGPAPHFVCPDIGILTAWRELRLLLQIGWAGRYSPPIPFHKMTGLLYAIEVLAFVVSVQQLIHTGVTSRLAGALAGQGGDARSEVLYFVVNTAAASQICVVIHFLGHFLIMRWRQAVQQSAHGQYFRGGVALELRQAQDDPLRQGEVIPQRLTMELADLADSLGATLFGSPYTFLPTVPVLLSNVVVMMGATLFNVTEPVVLALAYALAGAAVVLAMFRRLSRAHYACKAGAADVYAAVGEVKLNIDSITTLGAEEHTMLRLRQAWHVYSQRCVQLYWVKLPVSFCLYLHMSCGLLLAFVTVTRVADMDVEVFRGDERGAALSLLLTTYERLAVVLSTLIHLSASLPHITALSTRVSHCLARLRAAGRPEGDAGTAPAPHVRPSRENLNLIDLQWPSGPTPGARPAWPGRLSHKIAGRVPTCIVGGVGVGKSTLARTLVGSLAALQGSVSAPPAAPPRWPRPLRARNEHGAPAVLPAGLGALPRHPQRGPLAGRGCPGRGVDGGNRFGSFDPAEPRRHIRRGGMGVRAQRGGARAPRPPARVQAPPALRDRGRPLFADVAAPNPGGDE